ncbi:hypothetical protein PVAP13_J683334 [Panicum virgatum]|nr:hypothetical protein PVAP13_J683334 [Panicum virgatum]
MAMAGSLLRPWVEGLVGKASDALVQRVSSMWGVDNYRRKLEDQLMYVRSLLADAEEKAEAKTEAGRAVKAWMKKLKAAAYEADDVLNAFQYEALRDEAQAGESTSRKVLYFSSDRIMFNHKASRDLKNVLDKIEELVMEMNTFGLLERAKAPQALYRQTYSALDESLDIFGRDDDKEAVVKILLDQKDQKVVQVLPIIGMGGLGKTTLAKMVYNDHNVQNHFNLMMWYCVSENFEAAAVVRSIIELATKGTCDLPDNMELLRGKLQEAIGKKRFLLVLDDVWNEEPRKWEDDLKPLLCSSNDGSGSMIIVTSRSQQVASIMGTLPPHELACLSEDDSWKLFTKKAFNNRGAQEQPDELVTFGRRIVNRCKGLPLALKTMGGLMSSMHQAQEWRTIAESNMGDTGNEVLSILKLSYRYLSSEMKQCFAFCAVFPKDYEMEKDKFIQLWMANGFIHEKGNMDLAKKGEFLFKELVQRSFLQDVNVKGILYGYKSYKVIRCKMHDLMHDLAKDVTDECAFAVEFINKKIPINDGVRHMLVSSFEWKKANGLFKSTSSLHTLLTHSENKDIMEINLMSLRALQLGGGCPSVIHKQLINTIHLRYLDISGSNITKLPDSLCLLYNLQSLRLNNCHELQYLPEGLTTSLKKLIHIYLLGCPRLEQMPPKIGLLHNLHTLTTFIVGTSDGFGIEELKDLRHLGNRLELYNLRNVKSGSKANLHEKQNLSELLLCWPCSTRDDATDVDAINEERVLESLAPHPEGELKELDVHGYGGLAIPQWMKDPRIFLQLRELNISHCPRCVDLPMVWSFPCLGHLSLSNMDSLTTLCRNVDVEAAGHNTPLQIFPVLKTMRLMHLPKLERWAENSAGEINSSMTFPPLESLSIINCDKLASFPDAPVLKYLYLSSGKEKNSATGALVPMPIPLDCLSSLVRLNISFLPVDVVMPPDGQQSQSQRPLDTLRYLQLEGDDGFASTFNKSKLQLGLGDCWVFVEELDIRSCSNIVRWPVEELRCLPRLRRLHIKSCSKLEGKGSSSEEEEILPLPQLDFLRIYSCDSLLRIPKLPASLEKIDISFSRSLLALPSNLGDLAKLRNLRVLSCGALKELPDGMDGLTSLERLEIGDCPGIERFPQGLLQRLPALEFLWIWDCPDLQRRCREGGEYFHLVASIPYKLIPAPAPEPAPGRKKPVKWFLPSCGGGSQSQLSRQLRCVRMLPLSPPLSHQLILLLLYCSTSHYCLFRHHHNSRLRPICMHFGMMVHIRVTGVKRKKHIEQSS